MTSPVDAPSFCPNCGAPAGTGGFCSNCGHDLHAAPSQTRPGEPVSPASVGLPPAVRLNWSGIVVLIAAALVILGSFLPWISATAAFVGTISRNGIDGGGDGVITIVLGILLALLAVALLARSGNPRVARIGVVVAALAVGWVAYTDIVSVNERIDDLASEIATASVGMGLVVIVLGAVLALIGVILPRGDQPSEPVRL